MINEILTLEETAKYLRVSENAINEWAQRGEIPAKKIENEWRFQKAEIEKWINGKLSFDRGGSQIDTQQIQSMLSSDRILFFDCHSKKDALTTLAKNLATARQITSESELINGILMREELMSTAIGKGIAIPHIRLESVTGLVVSVGISKTGITDFNPLDDLPVRLLIMIAASSNQHAMYLQALSYFSARLRQDSLRSALLASENADEARRLLSSS